MRKRLFYALTIIIMTLSLACSDDTDNPVYTQKADITGSWTMDSYSFLSDDTSSTDVNVTSENYILTFREDDTYTGILIIDGEPSPESGNYSIDSEILDLNGVDYNVSVENEIMIIEREFIYAEGFTNTEMSFSKLQ